MTIITPKWQAPLNVKAFTSTRLSGHSHYPYHHGNLGLRIGDYQPHVLRNRDQLIKNQLMPSKPLWLNQSHSTKILDATVSNDINADASITRTSGQVLAILTADCLPIVITNREGTEVAAIHAGWRGLCHGIIENTIKQMQSKPSDCIAWIGPGICGHCFEVGEEVCQQFQDNYDFVSRYCFLQHKWHIPLDLISAHILHVNGILSVTKSNLCTFEQKNLFYSYRRDGQTGRIGTFIWFEQPKG